MQKGIFKTLEARDQFIHSLGTFYAALGGLFGAYREAKDAFNVVPDHHLYRHVMLTDADYSTFEAGFVSFQQLRIAMQVEKALAEQRMKAALSDTSLHGDIKVSPAKDASELIQLQQQGKAKQS